VDWIAESIETGAPGVVPQATPVGLLLEADDLGHLGPGRLSLPEGTHLREPTRPGADDRYPS
jgi:hypothetical protein